MFSSTFPLLFFQLFSCLKDFIKILKPFCRNVEIFFLQSIDENSYRLNTCAIQNLMESITFEM